MISENLELLKKLDPTTWKRIMISLLRIHPYSYFNRSVEVRIATEILSNPGDAPMSTSVLQGRLQTAISSHIDPSAEKATDTAGYRIEQGRDGCEAYVWMDWKKTHFGHGDSPAEALLAAYCEAIQSPLPANHRQIEDRNEWDASHYLPGDEPE